MNILVTDLDLVALAAMGFMNVAVPVAVAAARLMLNLKRLILELFWEF